MSDGWAAWVSAGAAVASVAGGAFAWWHGTLSKRARRDAEAARDSAVRRAEAAEGTLDAIRDFARSAETAAISARDAADQAVTQSQQLRRIADAQEKPALVIAWDTGSRYLLRNQGRVTVSMSSVVNREQFFRCGLKTPSTLESGQSVGFLMVGAGQLPMPGHLSLSVDDRVVNVPIPPRRSEPPARD